MSSDGFWQVFTDTGDPLCWLLTRDSADGPRGAANQAVPEETNNASDGGEPSG